MKKLLFALLIFMAVNTLSAFDKVWELQFSSTPHHVHYTEGHKELIVGEGNTFKKYNAVTGALIDSVVMSFDSVLTKSIISYFITDDLKQIYALMPKAAKIKYDGDTMEVVTINLITKSIDSTVFQLAARYGDPYNTNLGLFSFEFPGQLVQYLDRKFIYYANARLGKTLPDYGGQSGILVLNSENNVSTKYSGTGKILINSYKPTLYAAGSFYESWKIGAGSYTSHSEGFQYIIKMEDRIEIVDYSNFKFEVYTSCISKYNKYLYSQAYNSYSISRTDFKNIESRNLGKSIKWLLPYRNDDEVLLRIDNKIYHYNFKVNTFLDSIELSTEINFGTDLSNDFLLSIGSNKVAAYKSSFKVNTVASILKDTLLTKSTGDTINLNAISNLSPIKEEWDLGDGRTVTGDTVRFSYPKSGEYVVKYTATYKDTVVKHTCKITVLTKLEIEFDYKVDVKNGYTELTLYPKITGDSVKSTTQLTHVYINSKFSIIDSSENKIIYKLIESGIYKIYTTALNSSETISKDLYLVIPISKLSNTEYEYNNLNMVYNIILFKNNLYLLNCSYSLKNIELIYPPWYNYILNLETTLNTIDNYRLSSSKLVDNTTFNMSIPAKDWQWQDYALKYTKENVYKQKSIFDNKANVYIQYNKNIISIFEDTTIHSYNFPIVNNINPIPVYYTIYFKENMLYHFLCNYIDSSASNSKRYFSYSIDDNDGTISEKVKLSSNYYDDIAVFSDTKNRLMLSSVKDLKVFSIDNSYRIIDTLMTEKYNKAYSKSILSNHAFAIIDTSAKDTNQYLKVMDIKNKKSKLVKLDSTVKYHQVYQVNDSITCLMGRKDKDLVIETFKNKLLYFSAFKIEHTGMFTILEKTDDNELHLSFVDTSIPASNLIKTKGFASIFDFVSKSIDTTSIPDDSTSIPIDTTKKDTTKNKRIIYNNVNQFGSVIQDPDYKSAKIYLKDSLDLTNSLVKIYTETGDEILTYYLSKDQKELPIRTDKLFHGTYYVRLLTQGEEHNLGKFIIVR